ncbi:glycosyl transferase family protein [Paraburkholderia hospita]|uniref:Glycosyl transferase family protein n=1 Tax=Paraburkholderia hospita TaxID=169430 RepID=A0ABP2PIU9_9BURK|nr:glycosyl transferase family protein [Paraburkholderia hospita]
MAAHYVVRKHAMQHQSRQQLVEQIVGDAASAIGSFACGVHVVVSSSASSCSYRLSPGRTPVNSMRICSSVKPVEADQVAREADDRHRLAHVENEDLTAMAHARRLQNQLRGLWNRREEVSDLRDVHLDLPEEVYSRDVAGDSRWRASAMLVYKRLMRRAVGARTARELTRRNSLTSPYLWLLCLIAVGPATLFWRHTLHLFCFVIVFAATYVWLYVSIVRFKSPRWLVIRKRRHS